MKAFISTAIVLTLLCGCSHDPVVQPEAGSERHMTVPDRIDASGHYLFYLHGRIVEDLGIHAVSREYGEYQYEQILDRLASDGFIVISEPRAPQTDVEAYAARMVSEIESLLEAGVPPEHITVVGASKGAYIATLTSHLAQNSRLNYVLLATCHPESVQHMRANHVDLYGSILAIRDYADHDLSGSCEEVFEFSEGVRRHQEIVLDIGTGHGILYKPLDEWIVPTIEWARSADD